jgi:hypothetical protein
MIAQKASLGPIRGLLVCSVNRATYTGKPTTPRILQRITKIYHNSLDEHPIFIGLMKHWGMGSAVLRPRGTHRRFSARKIMHRKRVRQKGRIRASRDQKLRVGQNLAPQLMGKLVIKVR